MKSQFPISIINTSTLRNTNVVFPCKLCSKNINNRDAAIHCDTCQFLVHPWFCLSCCSTILPLGNLTDEDFPCSVLNKRFIEISDKISSVLLKPPLTLLFNQFNNSSPEQKIDPENVVNSRYIDIDQIQSSMFIQKEKSLFLPY